MQCIDGCYWHRTTSPKQTQRREKRAEEIKEKEFIYMLSQQTHTRYSILSRRHCIGHKKSNTMQSKKKRKVKGNVNTTAKKWTDNSIAAQQRQQQQQQKMKNGKCANVSPQILCFQVRRCVILFARTHLLYVYWTFNITYLYTTIIHIGIIINIWAAVSMHCSTLACIVSFDFITVPSQIRNYNMY